MENINTDIKNVIRKLSSEQIREWLNHKGYGNQWVEETIASLHELDHALDTPLKFDRTFGSLRYGDKTFNISTKDIENLNDKMLMSLIKSGVDKLVGDIVDRNKYLEDKLHEKRPMV